MDDKAVAYTFLALVMFIICMGAIYLCITVAGNGVGDIANSEISKGTISTQTAGVLEWTHQWIRNIPIIGIILALIWAIIAALEERRNSGT